ncbi:4-hydroxy-4-methyl-2-oxoglutarate aldolase [Tindallia magadiensis]|uniref:Putative 4-hydroxy-4-methyl-2-oxoglutarate aldolase n=2 Tax=Tindallia magadiensis TaxID=69895 RepID=A0A1I3EVW7_9FIRM|nr:4-hydroxy-4-methyl-2-oxoglutarate aldolase [Tindallia magadiensis]
MRTKINRLDQVTIEKVKQYDTTLLADGAGSRIALSSDIKPVIQEKSIVGPAITLKLTLGDSLLVSKAIDIAQAGDIIVIDAFGTDMNAVWGDLKSLMAKQKNIAGVIIDGSIRDVSACREIGVQIYCKNIVCSSSTKNSPGEINVPIVCGGMNVNPGDIVVGDENGVVILPADKVDEILENAKKKQEMVEKVRQEIIEGKYISDNISEKMKQLGYEEESG